MHFIFNPLYTCILDTLANSEDSAEMPHGVDFHHGLHGLLKTTAQNYTFIWNPRYVQWIVPSICIEPGGEYISTCKVNQRNHFRDFIHYIMKIVIKVLIYTVS